jgi:hypothetical protein
VDPCLTAFGTTDHPARCQSVALCLDGAATATECTCGAIGQNGSPPLGTSCAAIDCGPDAKCDQATGLCSNGSGLSPGTLRHANLPLPNMPAVPNMPALRGSLPTLGSRVPGGPAVRRGRSLGLQ